MSIKIKIAKRERERMNLFNNSERRTRVKKPVSIIIISLLLILSPIYNYSLQLLTRSLPINWLTIQSLHFSGLELSFLILPVICGFGLFFIKKWSWYLFIFYSIGLILFNIYAVIVNPVKFNFYSLFESTIIFLGAAHFLKKDISAAYLKMYPRGWRGEKRKPIQIQVRIDDVDKLTKDISEAGFYVDWKDIPYEINQEVGVQLGKTDKRKFAAGVVRKDENGAGFAFRSLTEEGNQWLKEAIKNP